MTTPTPEELAALGDAFDHFTRRYKLAEVTGAERPLGEIDKQLLFFVARSPGCGPSDVARYLGVPGTTITSAADRMAKRGLIARDRPDHDRRAVSLTLTDTGRARVDALHAGYADLHRQMLGPLTAAERRQLVAMLHKMVSSDG